jgi:hypothetical protein
MSKSSARDYFFKNHIELGFCANDRTYPRNTKHRIIDFVFFKMSPRIIILRALI